ncbi:MAG: hypothetical protein V4689_20820 [Verrucomicrobiota bacterium]
MTAISSHELPMMILKRKMANHNGSEADMDEHPSNPESKYTEYTEYTEKVGIAELGDLTF